MNRITYSRGKMLAGAAFFALLLGFFLFAFFMPEELAHVRRARALTSGLGRAVFLPTFIAVCAAFVWRGLSVALIDPVAIEFKSAHLRLNAFWGWREVRWADISDAVIEWHGNYPNLRVDTFSGGWLSKRIRVPLGVANIRPGQALELLEAILSRAGSIGASPAQAGGASSAFDADAALARYLAENPEAKSLAASDAKPAVNAPVAQRPAFGRKGL